VNEILIALDDQGHTVRVIIVITDNLTPAILTNIQVAIPHGFTISVNNSVDEFLGIWLDGHAITNGGKLTHG